MELFVVAYDIALYTYKMSPKKKNIFGTRLVRLSLFLTSLLKLYIKQVYNIDPLLVLIIIK